MTRYRPRGEAKQAWAELSPTRYEYLEGPGPRKVEMPNSYGMPSCLCPTSCESVDT